MTDDRLTDAELDFLTREANHQLSTAANEIIGRFIRQSRSCGVSEDEALKGGRWINADDVSALVRRLDVALNGDGNALQASLCDIVSQVEQSRSQPLRCFECDHELHGPFCPACNPDLAELTRPKVGRVTQGKYNAVLDMLNEMESRAATAEAALAEAVGVVEAFARMAQTIEQADTRAQRITADGDKAWVPVGHLRRAARFLARHKPTGPEAG